MAGNLWGEGPRGGIFGARIDPALLRELEKRAAEKRNEIERSTLSGRAKQWWDKSTFFKPAYEELVGAATLPGDVMSGAQPTMAMDPQTGEFHTAPELMDRAGALAGSMTLGAGAIPAEANALRMGIKAYHGSPHDFERFDASKIGTGEGAQAYGHGLYFAEREGVAKDYREKLSKGQARGATLALNNASGDVDMAMAAVRGEIDRLKALPNAGNDPARRDSLVALNEQKLAELQKFKDSGSMTEGRMYEVDIAAEPEQFLDWDKPLSEQPQQIQDLWREKSGIVEHFVQPSSEFYRSLGDPSAAAEALQQAGIPGIRYLDQGSRVDPQELAIWKAGLADYEARGDTAKADVARKTIARLEKQAAEGTRNYVVFDDKLISILKKYGLPISAAGLAALTQLHPEEAKAAQRKDSK